MALPQRLTVGEIFNSLTVVELLGYEIRSNGRKIPMALCRCACGAVKKVAVPDLKSGATKTCGNYGQHPYSPRPRKQEPTFKIGEVFGKLVVQRFVEYSVTPGGVRVPKMECLCECGNTKIVGLWDLRSGKTKTCGMNHPFYEDRSEPAFNNYYEHTYKAAAKRRGLVFKLTKDEFRALTQQNCFYCGSQPREIKRPTGTLTSTCLANGIDRVDNQIGYVMTNVVPCCFDCNHAKATLSQKQFLELANKVAQRHPVMVD